MAVDDSPQHDAQKPSAFLSDASSAAKRVRFYDFEGFRLDTLRRVLLRDGAPVAIKPKALETLLVLVEHRGRTVDKQELMNRLWPDTAVEEANLTQNVFVARKALGEAMGESRFIATVARQGYRFVADVREVTDETQQESGDRVPAARRAVAPQPSAPRRPRVARRVALAGGLLLAALVAGVVMWGRRPALTTVGPIRSIAVLPFRNVSGDAEDDYFADGMTDAVTADLASISSLRVISRQSVIRFRNSTTPLPEVARALGVDALIEGSVARGGGRIRLTAQLVHGATDRHLWAESYERELGNVLSLQGELARSVADAIRATVSDMEHDALVKRKQVDPEAYSLYLRAEHFVNLRGPSALERSIGLYQQSIERDPSFAAAFGGLAIAHILSLETVPQEEGIRRTRAAAAAALALDPRQTDGQIARLLSTSLFERDWEAGLRGFERIVQQSPNHETAHSWYGSLLLDLCRRDEGLAQRQIALRLDPLSLASNNSMGLVMALRGRYDEAVQGFHRALELDPNYADAHGWLGWTYLTMGRRDDAIKEFEACARLSGESPRMLARLAHAYGLVGRSRDARRLLRTLERRAGQEVVRPMYFAHIYAGLGDFDLAFARLDEAYRERSLIRLNSDPLLVPLYVDPRFGQLAGRMNLPGPCR